MVWIHGGAFLFGSSIDGSYDGRALVGFNDVVFASINYRLAAFGFLATGDPELRGNYGLWDQSEALKWIKENIAAFGGDPDRITIFGQSAGGASVGHQLIGQPSWEYFNRAMPISAINSGTQQEGFRAYPEQIPRRNPYSDYDKFVDRIERFTYVDKTAVTVNAIEQQYIDWQLADNPSTNYFYNYMDLMTDEAFHCPAEHTARTYALNGNKVYRYYFNHMPARSIWPSVPSWWGIAHAEDIPFFFGWAFSDTFNWFQTAEEKTLALDMMRYFTNFAKTGYCGRKWWSVILTWRDNDGQEGGESDWPEFTVPGLISKEFKPNLPDIQGLRSDYCQLWNGFLVDLGEYTDTISDAELAWREEFSRWKNEDLPEWRTSFNDYVDNPETCDP
ncbi:putative acetylcholinesterase [Apostichopus japonicus]|uniref:Carboxylic ester hydrolase n=1 Tax=Stichopus japonicus TaxID=307972 RepID=A0A2G8LAZ5_STIJA|nr:putative acetylcholinesterase [Apostichopus japonicus]